MHTLPTSIRLSRTEREIIRAAAIKMDRSASDLIRAAALALADRVLAERATVATGPGVQQA